MKQQKNLNKYNNIHIRISTNHPFIFTNSQIHAYTLTYFEECEHDVKTTDQLDLYYSKKGRRSTQNIPTN